MKLIKATLFLLFCMAILNISISYAEKLELSTHALFPVDKDVSQGYGLEGKYIFNTGLYPYLSYDLNPTEYLGHDMGLVNLASFGGGWTKTWNKRKHGFTVAVDGGWYSPHDSDLERTEYSTRKQRVEVGDYKPYCNYPKKYIKPIYVDISVVNVTKIEYSGGLGCKALLGYSYSINNVVSSTLSLGYRYLELDETINGKSGDQDFSAGIVMISFRLRF